MRRRFGRGRRRNSDQEEGRSAPIDAAQWMSRILETASVEAERLEPVELEDVPDSFAALGLGEQTGRPVCVAFAPERGADAALAALAWAARRRREAEPEATLYAVAPDWSARDRQRLGLLSPRLPLAAVASSALAGGSVRVAPERPGAGLSDPAQLAGRLDRGGEREIFTRALAALEGLAAKHGGALRASGERVELVVMARRCAALEAQRGALRIEVFQPERTSLPLTAGDALPTALDRLEGLLRKLLNDRKLRGSESGMRSALLPVLERAAPLVARALWPLGGPEGEPVDWIGLDADGRTVVGAARETLDLPALAEILDATVSAPAIARELARRAGSPASSQPPRLVLAAGEFEGAALDACAALGLQLDFFDARARRSGDWTLEPRTRPELGGGGSEAEAGRDAPALRDAPSERGAASREERGGSGREERGAASRDERGGSGREERGGSSREERSSRSRTESASGREEGDGGDARRDGGRSRRGRSRRPAAAAAASADDSREDSGRDAATGFEEISLFDLDEGGGSSESPDDDDSRRRGRSRGRRRGRRGRGSESGRGEQAEGGRGEGGRGEGGRGARAEGGRGARAEGGRGERAEGGRGERGRARDESDPGAKSAPRSRDRQRSDEEDDEDPLLGTDDDDTLAPLAEDAPDLEETETPSYEEDDEEEEADPEADRARRQRELRQRARAAKPPEPPPPPRRRAAFLAHADPISVLTAVVLARDVRLVEGFWVYPQEDLMTFFRSIATDLREETPIFLVGFAAAQPARDTVQTASLYRGRLDWFDHHEWPPEDLEALRSTLGAEHVHVESGADSSLAAVIGERTRRSRFSDKLVELITGRFSQHDYERWGRWWWHRAQEIAQRPGERRAEIDPLLAGRPSDLARAVAQAAEPPLPPELAYISGRDFRLVHFGGFSMVVLEVPDELDLHLAARIARERYEAQISLAIRPGGDLAVLGGDDSRAQRGLDLGGMAAHLASKHAWVEALADDDHVARMRVQGLHGAEGRLDELVTEIAMGRSIVEG